jgi:hypothetical protein
VASEKETMALLFAEIAAERKRQNKKWGEQDYLSFDPVLMDREGGCSVERLAEYYGIPGPERARYMTATAADHKELTWMHVLVEEVAELIEEKDNTAKLRAELIQCAAVCAAWIECLDRQKGLKH